MPYRHCSGLLWIALLCCWLLVGGIEGRLVRVTVSGVEWNWTANGTLPSNWVAGGATRLSLKNSTGDCPAGRYCPQGTIVPLMCPLGTFNTATRRSAPCNVLCAQGSYCPDPGKAVKCPNNTRSERGAVSQLGCACLPGFQCNYRRVLSVNVGLRIPYRVMLGSEGDGLRQALLRAVAETAGVSLDSVRIDKVLPGKVAGGARRLLGDGGADDSALLSLSVEGGGGGLDGLRARLGEHRDFRRAASRVRWTSVEKVQVLPSPSGREWGFWRQKS